jgi:hypothetical protein
VIGSEGAVVKKRSNGPSSSGGADDDGDGEEVGEIRKVIRRLWMVDDVFSCLKMTLLR